MDRSKSYLGIDCFRFIAAILVITIHTSPLASFCETGDFILTRIIARVAVPFFFMTSGFFIISRYTYNAKRLQAFIKKTVIIYAVAILIYIPINIYNGYFSMNKLLPNIIKDIVFDGTMYHLWYLPASIIGVSLAWFFVKRYGFNKALSITFFLYVTGLFGDSYYGIAEKNHALISFYNLIFQISDYTRNGIFFAPVFFVLGGFLADKSRIIPLGKSTCGFIISFSLMLGESLLLHHYDFQRHDSMYIFLLPCMFFLFSVLLNFRGKRKAWLTTSSLIIYIIHPLMIVAIRLITKLLGLPNVLFENSLVNYVLVCITSVSFSLVATVFWNRYKKKKISSDADRAWIEIDLNNLKHNVKAIENAMPADCELMAVVKAEAYGHGAFEISTYLNRIGVKAFAVATIEEGIKLRKFGIQGQILILGYTNIHRASELKKYDLTQTLIDFEYANALNKQGISVKAHIKIDTGMHRLGFENVREILEILNAKHLDICGIYTHLCVADSLLEDNIDFTRKQIFSFYQTLDKLKECNIELPKIHIQSSYGLLNYPELKCNYVRMGIALYGVLSSPNDNTILRLDLRPVFSLKSRVILIRKIQRGESVGYGRAFVAMRESQIAIMPIGYADGFPRSCKNGEVLIHGLKAPIIGQICMDHLAIDITDMPDVTIGDVVTLIGKDGSCEIMASNVAYDSGSITNELLSRMGSRLKIKESKFLISK